MEGCECRTLPAGRPILRAAAWLQLSDGEVLSFKSASLMGLSHYEEVADLENLARFLHWPAGFLKLEDVPG
jgi:hypothetical protein